MRDASDLWDCRAVRLAGRGFPIYVNLERSQMINLAILGGANLQEQKVAPIKEVRVFTFSVQKKPCGARSDRHGRNVSIYFSLFPVGEKKSEFGAIHKTRDLEDLSPWRSELCTGRLEAFSAFLIFLRGARRGASQRSHGDPSSTGVRTAVRARNCRKW